jgi:hypothetical protein
MITQEGETDVLVVFESETKRRLGIHIENKLGPGEFTQLSPPAPHWRDYRRHFHARVSRAVRVELRRVEEHNAALAAGVCQHLSMIAPETRS